jgi:branched-chain amino acid transport system ATP-binding protein
MLEIQNIEAGYGEITILRNISFFVRKGEIISLIGRNGVGKSTLMKTIIGLLQCRSGKISFQEKDITNTKPYERAQRGMGYVPQGHGVFPLLTVEENLKMGAGINLEEKNKTLDIAYTYFPRLDERRAQKAGTLSGGEQAMLSIARIVTGRPKMMLLDEPSEGIQPNLVQQIGEIVRRLASEMGITVILCEQHMGLIQQVSQRCYAIDKGAIVSELNSTQLCDYSEIKKHLAV